MLSSAQIQACLDGLTKPPGSLGKLEQLAARLCQIQQTLTPETQPRELFLFGADHGVVQEGVTAWPSEITTAMMNNIAQGGAASSVLAKSTNTRLHVIDVGTFSEPIQGVELCRVRKGSRNLAQEPALTPEEFAAAQNVGRTKATEAAERGVKVVLAGEMGIGNTTPASCLAMLLADLPLNEAVGKGAGADETILKRKRQVVDSAVKRARTFFQKEPTAAIASVAGLEIAAISGFYLEAYAQNLTILLDGFITSAAALIASFQEPRIVHNMIAAHLSEEQGHRAVLNQLGLTPLLDWKMRLGEGTGALLLTPLLDAAAAMVSEMSTLSELGFAPEETSS